MNMNEILPAKIEKMIYVIRGQKVMLDFDLAELYGVETKYLNRVVKRNLLRFPKDFMFQLDSKDLADIRCQFVTLDAEEWFRYPPHAFTENGVAMLSGLLNSERAISVNISIMRTFTKMRALLLSDRVLSERLHELEKAFLPAAIISLLIEAKNAGMTLALVTSSERVVTDELLRMGNVRDYFSLVITRDDVPKHKPDPLPYLKALELTGHDATEVMIFEDSEVGIEAAKGSGAIVMRADWHPKK